MQDRLERLSRIRIFGGIQAVYAHESESCGCRMTFGLFIPKEAGAGGNAGAGSGAGVTVPLLWWLSGLTCTHENAMQKAGAQRWAARHAMAIVFPDTSPRGEHVADDSAYDLGQGAGFYIDAARPPWAPHFSMERYIVRELPDLLFSAFPSLDRARQGISGHSMGGHGALTLAMKHPDSYRSLSAFAPIAHPSASDWGRRQFSAYLGKGAEWKAHDAACLLRAQGWKGDMLVDQGLDDMFLAQLMPHALTESIYAARVGATIRLHEGYDHSYYFVSSFMEDHIAWHAERLR